MHALHMFALLMPFASALPKLVITDGGLAVFLSESHSVTYFFEDFEAKPAPKTRTKASAKAIGTYEPVSEPKLTAEDHVGRVQSPQPRTISETARKRKAEDTKRQTGLAAGKLQINKDTEQNFASARANQMRKGVLNVDESVWLCRCNAAKRRWLLFCKA